jgi:hypothetical protein
VSDKRLTDSELEAVETFATPMMSTALVRLVAEVREHRTRTAPAGLTQEERVHLSGVRDYIANVYMVWPGAKPAWLAVIDRLLASTAPAPARHSPPCCPHPVERHAYNGCANCGCSVRWPEHPDRDLDTSPEAIAQRAPAPAGGPRQPLPVEVLADARHDRIHEDAGPSRPARVASPAPASGGRYDAFIEQWARYMAAWCCDGSDDDQIRDTEDDEWTVIDDEDREHWRGFVRHLMTALGIPIATPATAEREG